MRITDCGILENYIEKIYGYAVRHTFSQEEADELSQEILLTLIKEFPKLRDSARLEPWLWGVAKNVTKSFSRTMGKQRAMYSYNSLESLVFEEEYSLESNELYGFLREKIAMLSEMYRNTVILYYYDGLSTKQIADRLNIPEGTVTWRLSEARKKLKREFDNMTETALKPQKLRIRIYGTGNYGRTQPFPHTYISDALSQNILFNCYYKTRSTEELSKLCGVPAYYIEDRIDNLLQRNALKEISKGKYQTDFAIISDKHREYCEKNAERLLLPIMDKLLCALEKIASEAAEIKFYKAEKSESDLYYLYGVMSFLHIKEKYGNSLYPHIPKNYDGFEWRYIGHTETENHLDYTVGWEQSANLGSRGSYSHISYNNIGGTQYRYMMTDNYINVCEDILTRGDTEDTLSAASAIKEGYIEKRQDGLFVTVPAFTKAQKAQFDKIAEKYLSPLFDEYNAIAENFIAGYKKLFPPHLNDDAERLCRGIFTDFYGVITRYAQRNGRIKMPSPDYVCDVLIQFK